VLWGADQHRALSVEQHNVRTAIEWSAEQNHWDLVGRLASRGLDFSSISGCDVMGRWLSEVLEHRDRLSNHLLTACLAAASWAANGRLDLGQFFECSRQAVEVAEGESSPWLPLAMVNLGLIASMRGDDAARERAEALTARGVHLGRSAHSHVRFTLAFIQGLTLTALDEFDRAEVTLGELSRLAKLELDESGICALAPSRRALVLHLLGRYEDSLEAAREGAEAARSLWHAGGCVLGMWSDPGWGLISAAPLGLALAMVGRLEEARTHLEQLLRTRRTSMFPGVLHESLLILAAIAAMQRDWKRAARLLGAMDPNAPGRFPVTALMRFYYAKLVGLPLPNHAFAHGWLRSVTAALPTEEARRWSDEGASMSVDEALDYGIEAITTAQM